MLILPVIHHIDDKTSLEQAEVAFDAGADGIFLISHEGEDLVLANLGQIIKVRHNSKLVGLNFLSHGPMYAAKMMVDAGLDLMWADNCGVSSAGLTGLGEDLREFAANNPSKQIFASVAFKYQDIDVNPPLAAKNALNAGFIPTTSGAATGAAPTVEKISSMSSAVGGKLAIASGMTVDNIASFAPYLSHVLVATGVSVDEHHFDFEALTRFIAIARNSQLVN